MINLREKTNINFNTLKAYIIRLVAKEISNLTRPCYKPTHKAVYHEILKMISLNEADLKQYTKEKWQDSKWQKLNLQIDKAANLFVFLMTEALRNNDRQLYQFLVTFYLVRHYGSLFDKHFPKYCDENVFRYTLDVLTKTHLFAREKTVGNALYYLSIEIAKRHEKGIKKDDLEAEALFMNEARHRVSQSVKSFAETYYSASEAGKGYKTQPQETGDEEKPSFIPAEKSRKVLDDIVRNITVYKFVDIKSQEEARSLTKILSSLATQITNGLCDTKHTDSIRLIYDLFIEGIPETSILCGKKYYVYVNALMSIKRIKAKLYFKQQVTLLLIKVLSDIKYLSTYDSLSKQTKYQFSLFLAFYLTLVLRKSVCAGV